MSRSEAIGAALVMSTRQGPALATSIGFPSPVRSVADTTKCCRLRNSPTLAWMSRSFGAPRSAGRATSFQASVSGSSSSGRISHLSPGENLTPRTEDAEPDNEGEYDETSDHFTCFIMDRFIIAVT
jgi:hypothetical protein